jgi:hypothetical protein
VDTNLYRLRPLDVVLTVGHPPLGNFTHWIACRGIQFFQWRRGYRGRAWKQTHARWFIGKLSGDNIEQAVTDGRILPGIADNLTLYDDWMLSVTDPFVIWERWKDVCREDWTACRALMYTDARDITVAENACWKLIGEEYDRGQLIDIWLNAIMCIPEGEYVRILDSGTQHTVCSGGVAAGWEAVRRARVAERLPPAWPRLFGGTYVERVPPAMFMGRPRGGVWNSAFFVVGSKAK